MKIIRGKYLSIKSPGNKYSDGWKFYHNETNLLGFRICNHNQVEIAKEFLGKFGSDDRLNTTNRDCEELKECCREMLVWRSDSNH